MSIATTVALVVSETEEHMLGLSSLSGFSRDSSSVVQDVDLDLVERIIERAPRSATTFPLVYKAYGEVLEQSGLSAASDTAYYQFLLKLGIIRAPTWGERWDLWKATNTIQSRPHTSPRKDRTRFAAISGRPGDRSTSALLKARVPFLASASSDLDEGFDGDGESIIEGHILRPSPRKELRDKSSKSMVGHTPTPSVEYDLSTLTAPLRTSTPVHGRSGRHSPPLPPYTESDVSASPFPVRGRYTSDEPSTPRAPPQQLSETEGYDETALQEMERRADEFYETGLRGRCWDVWAQASDWVQKTTEQIDTVRSNIILRQTLARWRNVHRRHLALPNTADAHRQHQLKAKVLTRWMTRLREIDLQHREDAVVTRRTETDISRCWSQWRNRLIKNRTDRWARDMSSREKYFSNERDERLVHAAFNAWHDRTIDSALARRADEHFESRQKRDVLAAWSYRTEQKQRLEEQERDFAAWTRMTHLHTAFSAWRQQVCLDQAERQYSETRDRKLRDHVWDRWRAATAQRQTALELFERHSLSRAFTKWTAGLQRIKTLRAQDDRIRTKNDAIIVRQAFDHWVIAERGKLLGSVHDTRTARTCFAKWQQATANKADLQRLADGHHDNLEGRRLQSAFSRWRDVSGKRQNQVLQADLVHENKAKSKTFKIWVTAGNRLEHNDRVANNAQRFFAQRTALKCWKAALAHRKQERWLAQRERESLKGVFEVWMSATVQSVEGRQAVMQFQRQSDQRLLRTALGRWTRHVVEIRSREHDVIEKRDGAVLRDALSRWTGSAKRVKELKGLMHSFRDVKAEESLRSVLRTWKHQAVATRQHRLALTQAEKEREAVLLRETFGQWRSRYKELELAPIEEEVACRREDAVMFDAWDTWKAKSKDLKAVCQNHRRVKRVAMSRWLRALGLAQQAKQAKATADRHLLEDVFATWRDATKTKTSLKRARIRGRARHSSGVTETRHASTPQMRRPTPIDRTAPVSGRHDQISRDERGSSSVVSEPAYSRLRSELAGRRRGGSEDPEIGTDRDGNDVMKALRGALGHRS